MYDLLSFSSNLNQDRPDETEPDEDAQEMALPMGEYADVPAKIDEGQNCYKYCNSKKCCHSKVSKLHGVQRLFFGERRGGGG